MKNIWNTIWIVSFGCLILGIYILLPFKQDKESMENRALAEFPEVSLSALSEFPSRFENWYNDHLPYKNYITSLYGGYLYYGFQESLKEQYVVGKEKWLFYNGKAINDGDSIGQYTGTKKYSEEEMQTIAENLITIKNTLEKKDIELILFVPSNKEEIYSNYMPKKYAQAEGDNSTDQLMKYLEEHTDVKIVYPKEQLLKYRDEYKLYQKYDTHWNQVGAFVAVQELEKEMGQREATIEDITIRVESMSSVDGLSQRMGIADYLPPEEQYSVVEYETGHNGIKSKVQKSILMVGDSFRITPIIFLSKDYEKVSHIHRAECTMDYIEEVNPDILVLEFVERYVDELKHIDIFNEPVEN